MPLPILSPPYDRPRPSRHHLLAALAVLAAAVALALVVHAEDEAAPAAEFERSGTLSPLDALAAALGRRGNGELDRLVEDMPLERQVAQLFAVGIPGTDPGRGSITRSFDKHDWGAVVLQETNYFDQAQLEALVRGLQARARRAGHLPLLVGAPQEGGERSAFFDLPPRAQPRVARRGVRAVRREAARAGRRLRRLGVTMTLAPLADVAAEGGPVEQRAFGLEARFVAAATRAAVQGYRSVRVAPAVGRFPGSGATGPDPDLQPSPVGLTLTDLRRRDLLPFRAVARIAPIIVMSNALYAAYDGVTPATLTPQIVKGLLRRELRYRGVVMSANLVGTTAAYPTTVPRAAVEALKAGVDLLSVPSALDQGAAYRAVLAAVRRGDVSRAQVADSVRRILAVKAAYGIMRPDGRPTAVAR